MIRGNILRIGKNRFPNIIITVHCDVNGKMGRARNIGLTYASGEYIGYADSDDWTEPEMFEKMLEAAENGKMDVVVCKSIRDHGNDYDKSKAGTGRIDVMNIDSEVKRKEFIVANPMSYAVWDKIIRHSLLSDNNISFPEGFAYEDIYYGTLLHLYAVKIAFVDSVFYHYFVNPKSTVLLKDVGYHKDIMSVNRMLFEELNARGCFGLYHDELELDLLFTWYLGTVKVICLRFQKPPYDMFCSLKQEVLECMPDCFDNPYVATSMKEFYQLLVQLLKCNVTENELIQIADNFKKM